MSESTIQNQVNQTSPVEVVANQTSTPSSPPVTQPVIIKTNSSVSGIIFIYALAIVFFIAIVVLFGLFGKKDTIYESRFPVPGIPQNTGNQNTQNVTASTSLNQQATPQPVVVQLSGPAAVSYWKKINFKTFNNQKWCTGDRYIGYSERYSSWIGAELCDSLSVYKLYMSDSENGTYYQIADTGGNGQDHCELLNQNFTIPNDDDITSGGCATCSVGEMVDVQSEPVYVRSKIGESFKKQNSGYWAELTTKSYSCGVPIKENNNQTSIVPVKKIEAHGPGVNAMSCTNPSVTNLSNGKIACYGIWDYGNEFGDDPDMCYGFDGINKVTGCTVKTKACISGSAITTKAVKPTTMDVNSVEIATYAKNLKSTKEAVQQQIPTLWEYTCY